MLKLVTLLILAGLTLELAEGKFRWPPKGGCQSIVWDIDLHCICGHTAFDDPVRPWKLSREGPGRYLDGRPFGNTRKPGECTEVKVWPPKPTKPTKPIDVIFPEEKPRCWTPWFNRDGPSGSGDWELLKQLYRKYYRKICKFPLDMEVRTTTGLTPEQAGDVPAVMDPRKGFLCLNKDQKDGKCEDYRVRFSCPEPYCEKTVCWSDWFDHDDPSDGEGDSETLASLQKLYPGKICKQPQYIQAMTTDNIPASFTMQTFETYSPTEGLVCVHSDGQKCLDYKVRFGCCCDLVWLKE